jgi:hypothetical protein
MLKSIIAAIGIFFAGLFGIHHARRWPDRIKRPLSALR